MFCCSFNSNEWQAERTSLLDVLKANNIERPPMPELPPEPVIEPPPKSADKLDIMSRNCSELKATLAVLQGQMNALTAEKVSKEETTVVENTQPKKPKNKKNKANKSCPIKERASGSKTINTNGNADSNPSTVDGEVEGNDESTTKEETEIEPVVSSQNGDHLPATNVEEIVDDLVKDIQANCTIESQNGSDTPSMQTAENGESNVVVSTCSDQINNETLVIGSVNDTLLPVNVTSD